MPAIEIAAHQRPARFKIENRVIVGAVRLRRHPVGDPLQGIVENAGDLRSTPDGIGILQGFRRIFLQRGEVGFRLEEMGQLPGNPDLPRKRLGLADGGMKMVRLALQGMDGQGRSTNGGIENPAGSFHGDHGDPRHDGRPVHHGKRLLHAEGIGR